MVTKSFFKTREKGFLIFSGGEPVKQVVGAVPKSVLKENLDEAIA